MKRYVALMLTLVLLVGLVGCTNKLGKENEAVEDVVVGGDLIPMVRIDGALYFDTSIKSKVLNRPEGFDGYITSEVLPSEIPMEDDQSNFGTGYGYQYGVKEGTVNLYINENWWEFKIE